MGEYNNINGVECTWYSYGSTYPVTYALQHMKYMQCTDCFERTGSLLVIDVIKNKDKRIKLHWTTLCSFGTGGNYTRINSGGDRARTDGLR